VQFGGLLDLLGRQLLDQFLGNRPCRGRGVAGDGVQPDAEAQTATAALGELTHLRDLGRRGLRRLTPGQVDVDVLGRDRQRGRRRAAEIELRQWVRRLRNPAVLDRVVLALEVERLVLPDPLDDVQEFACPRIPFVMVQPVAKSGAARNRHRR